MHFADFSLDFWEANLHATPSKYMHIVHFEDLLLYEVGEFLKNWRYTKMNQKLSEEIHDTCSRFLVFQSQICLTKFGIQSSYKYIWVVKPLIYPRKNRKKHPCFL